MLPNLPVSKQAHCKEITCASLHWQWGIETLPHVDKKSRVSFPAVKSIPGFEGFSLIKLSGPTEENQSKLLNMEWGGRGKSLMLPLVTGSLQLRVLSGHR